MTLSLSRRSPIGLLVIMVAASCASHVAADTQSVQSGNWSDPSTWSTGQLPDASDAVTVSAGDTVVYDVPSARVAGVTVEDGATLAFHPDTNATLETDENVLVFGRLEMRPRVPNNDGWRNSVGDWRPYFLHTLRFVDVDERAFVGGGMDPVASDVGLWVTGDGVLDIAGAQKTGWTRLAGGARAGDTSLTLEAAPTGWRVGDVISITPTEHPSVGDRSWSGFEERTIGAIDGARVVFADPLDHDHPAVTDPWKDEVYTAEVMNLSRNVRIEGTGTNSDSFEPNQNGRAHIMIRSSVPQTIKYAELRLLGPRGRHARDGTGTVLGRYPLHFHHNGDNSRGSLVEGVVARNSGNRAFVPHASHGITFRDTVSYDVWEDAYWWDDGSENQSGDIFFDRTLAAITKAIRGFRLGAYQLGQGPDNSIRDAVAVGTQGHGDAAGYHWPGKANGAEFNVWDFEDNIVHNNKAKGIFVWQNDKNCHRIERFTGFRNGSAAVGHGAYRNDYIYNDATLFENDGHSIIQIAGPKPLSSSACENSDGYALSWRGLRGDGTILFEGHSLEWGRPALYLNCVIQGAVLRDKSGNPTIADFVGCTKMDGSALKPADFQLIETEPGTQIRVQSNDGSAFQIDETGKVTTISAFYDIGSGGGSDDTGSGGGSGDSEPPTAPSGLTAAVVSSTQVDLSWTASTDNVAVTGYRVYRDGTLAAMVSDTSYTDGSLKASTEYSYAVSAHDEAGNESEQSAPATVTTQDETPAPTDDPPISCTACVESFTLINSETDEDILLLVDGDLIDLAKLPTSRLNVRADTSPATVDKVVFDYNNKAKFATETEVPYALAGDRRGDYNDWIPSSGSNTITATPYLNGTAGTPLTVTFTVQ